MFAHLRTRRLSIITGSFVLLQLLASAAYSAAPVGTFTAVLNENRTNGDSMNTVSFFSGSDLTAPLFSVYVGREPQGSNEWEEPTAITVNPTTGDVYVVCFDSGTPAAAENPDPSGDAQADLDLLKIDFAAAYNHWSTNLQGHNVNAEALAAGPPPSGTNNQNNLDYVTYAAYLGDPGSGKPNFNAFHANQVVLPNVVQKIGQVARGNGGDFFDYALDFIDDNTLVLLDDSIGTPAADNALDDHSIRLITKVSASPGAASATLVTRGSGSSYVNGGFNGSNLEPAFPQASTQSWQSKIVEIAGGSTGDPKLLNLDLAGHSEPESIAYYKDPVTNVRGVWVTESDYPATGDAVAFLQLDANNETPGYRPIAGASNPNYLTLSNDPAAGADLKGQADNIFVDKDTGDLIIVESGFGDTANGVGSGDHEPAVLRVHPNYDNGSGQISFGTWETKKFLNPTKDPGDTFLERGSWSDYDSVNNVVYFYNPGAGGDTPAFEMDIYALDLDTGVTASYMNVDDSVSLFLGDNFGDKAIAFTLAAPGLLGDFNSDGKVDAGDYATWRKNEVANAPLANDNGVGNQAARFSLWRANFGKPPGAGSGLDGGSVPEPASALLFVLGLAAFSLRRCKD